MVGGITDGVDSHWPIFPGSLFADFKNFLPGEQEHAFIACAFIGFKHCGAMGSQSAVRKCF